MARAARQRRENELPYIPFGPFQIRFPFIHYKIESVEFIQGLILGGYGTGGGSLSGTVSGTAL